jgi:hypothetical protein
MGELEKHSPIYGGMYEYNATGSPVTIITAGTYYQWVTPDGNSVAGTDFLEYDDTNKQLVVKKAGWYDLAYKTVIFAPAGHQVDMGIFRTPDAGSPTVLPAHKGLVIMPLSGPVYPSGIDPTGQVGVLTGGVSLLAQADHNWLIGTEINAAPGFVYTFDFTTEQIPEFFEVWGKYVHFTTHYKKWSAWDYNTSDWIDFVSDTIVFDDMKDIGDDYDSFRRYHFPHSGTFIDAGNPVKVRITHISSGQVKDPAISLDQIRIISKNSRIVAGVVYPVYLNIDDRLDFRYTSDCDGDIVYSVVTNLSLTKIGDTE